MTATIGEDGWTTEARQAILHAQHQADMAQRRFEFLVEAGRTLASIREEEPLLAQIAEIVVPTLADICLVSSAPTDGHSQRAAVRHALAAKQSTADRLLAYPSGLVDQRLAQAPTPSAAAAAPGLGAAHLIAPVTDADLWAVTQDADHHAVWAALAPSALLIVPLVTAGQLLGTLQLAMVDPQRPFQPADLALVEALAERCAASLEHARINHQWQVDAARVRRLIEVAPDAVVIVDLAGSITMVNEQTEALFGYTRDELIGQSVERLMPERFRSAHVGHRATYAQRPVTRPMGQGLALYALRADGSEVPVDIRLAALAVDHEQLVISIIRDISDRVRVESELRRSNAELEQFAYIASHDLQEPLRMITSFSQLLTEDYRGRLDANADEYLAFITDGATRMQQLIQDLLAYSRVGTRGRPFALVDLNEIVDQVVRDLAPAVAESAAIITRGPLPSIWGDGWQLSQVFQNLLSNALKYRGEAPPRIVVEADRIPGGWRVSVSDNGIGLDPRYADQIFGMFQRLHGREEYPGTGIGLAICKKIIERHDGQIGVTSQPGQGATFWFTLPAGRRPHP